MKIWYPYTQHALEKEPLKIVKAKDAYVFDEKGNKYLDLISSWWVNIHGHAHPYIAKKIYEQSIQLEHVIFSGFTHDPAQILNEKLSKILPDDFKYLFFSDNGSTSVEVALKMILGSNKKSGRKFIALDGAYHGDTFGAMSVSSRGGFTSKFSKELFEVDFIPFPNEGHEQESLSALKKLLTNLGDYCGFICEPLLQGASGMRMYSVDVLTQLVRIAREAGCSIIFDEVFTGFGRTGKMFAFEYCDFEVRPDILCLSKGITGGFLPLGVTLCRQEYFDAYYSVKREDAFFHGHSYTANPLSCAAAVASLEVFEAENSMSKVKEIESVFNQFKKESRLLEAGFIIRSLGGVLAIDRLIKNNHGYFSKDTLDLKQRFLDKNLLIRPLGDTVYCVPPYCISIEDLKSALAAIEAVLAP